MDNGTKRKWTQSPKPRHQAARFGNQSQLPTTIHTDSDTGSITTEHNSVDMSLDISLLAENGPSTHRSANRTNSNAIITAVATPTRDYTELEVEKIRILLDTYPEQQDFIYRLASRRRTPALIQQMLQDITEPAAPFDS
eukprot:12454558-Ditylum_brightwellii.AAC.1